MNKLNLCSGQRPFAAPWINVDKNPKWTPNQVCDARKMPQFADGSADLIVIHHGAEHLTLTGSKAMFAEAHRILCPGGSLLVFVPDLHALAHAWIQGRITDYIFCVNVHGAYMDDEADIHRWSFTSKTLKRHLLDSAAWDYVVKFNWREILGANLSKDWWILATEAVKK